MSESKKPLKQYKKSKKNLQPIRIKVFIIFRIVSIKTFSSKNYLRSNGKSRNNRYWKSKPNSNSKTFNVKLDASEPLTEKLVIFVIVLKFIKL